jgi:hypothetical protein
MSMCNCDDIKKVNSQRQQKFMDKKKQQGWVRRCVWVPPWGIDSWDAMVNKLKKSWDKRLIRAKTKERTQ